MTMTVHQGQVGEVGRPGGLPVPGQRVGRADVGAEDRVPLPPPRRKRALEVRTYAYGHET